VRSKVVGVPIRSLARIPPSVQVNLIGGLGNQMFQYAAGLAVARKHRVPLVLDVCQLLAQPATSCAAWPRREYALDLFSLPAICSLRTRPGLDRWTTPVFLEASAHFDARFDELPPNVRLVGYWQSRRYFRSVEREVRETLTLPPPAGDEAVCRELADSPSICVHVRRGDFVENRTAAGLLGPCPSDYYRRACDRIAAEVPGGRFFVFSDDVEWCRTADPTGGRPFTIVSRPGGDKANLRRDFALMSRCRHFVIANSSLSWWAAWLAASPHARIVAPTPWFDDPAFESADRIPPTWLRVAKRAQCDSVAIRT
jgi:hypothetical protein